ncbi:MAG: dihydrofolate reductase [Spirochaetia bacterium]|nr:dihydrofolate reductase [Spirochaetia bacterium]
MKEINIIAAMTKKRVIGLNGTLPWRLPEDLKLFKKFTTGNIVIMGRKTFDSIGRPLPNRKNFVVSAHIGEEDKKAGVFYFQTLEDAINVAQNESGGIFIIGGASIYTQALGRADRLYISMVKKDFDGDTYFPEIKPSEWHVVSTEEHDGFDLYIYERN